jgi:hypothetical protein
MAERQNIIRVNPEILTVFDFLAGTNLPVGFSSLRLPHPEGDVRLSGYLFR